MQAILDDNFDPDSITQECVPADAAELLWAGKKMTRNYEGQAAQRFRGTQRQDKGLRARDIAAASVSPACLRCRSWPSCRNQAHTAPTREPIVDEKTQKAGFVRADSSSL